MKISNWTKVAGMVCVAALIAAAGTAQDWPQWRGADRDGKVTGFHAPEAWPKELAKEWTVTVGAGDASPALVDGKLYVFARQEGDEVILCLDAASGKEIWRDSYAAPGVESGPARSHPGPRSTPAVADGKVLTYGVSGIVSCLNAADGKEVWRKEPMQGDVPQFFTGSSPVIVDGMAVVQVGGEKGGMVALDLASGDEKWRWTEEGTEYSSPVVLDAGGVKQLAALTNASVVGIAAADGKLLWKVPYAIARMSNNVATPVVDGDVVIFTAASRGTHAVKIEKEGDGFAAKPVWDNADVASRFSTPTLHEGKLYGVSDRGNPFCLDAKTGATLWTDEESIDRMGFAPVLDAGSVIFALPSSAELLAFRPSDKEYSEVARIKVADAATYAHPIVAGNRVYVKDEQTLSLLEIQ